ncbi:hypothetical protein DACRYDRAFT_80114 [Dacryopinax primogenitus]|uniref:Uncharacterized protein n=1 Tax=Dacryopinax primogenitus (strain DJM 731) TaxID=1858805 RepID=M5G036_DACPD|nr:uncharacterized protein DACRYDRAFT_80114 [Dacryopinax primogenitus]EJU01515.1 hypothetical protein DACRYDRAFT_80114 [Dacryopinax primogenitus]
MSARLPPEAPKSKVLASLARGPLRSIIMVLTVAGVAWGLAFGIQSFRDIGFDRTTGGGNSLVTFDIIIGSLMCGFAVMMIIGFIVALVNRPTLARTFSFLSIFAGLVLCAGQLFIVIAHFFFQSLIIDECEAATTNATVITGNPFWFGYSEHTLSATDARNFCNSAFSRQSASTIIWLLVAIVASAIFVMIAMAWSYQILDPSYGRQAPPRADAIRMGSFNPSGEPYDQVPYAPRDPFADSRNDAYVPPYDPNMPPKYTGDESGRVTPPEKADGGKQGMYGTDRDAWAASDTDLAGPRIQERRPGEI